VNNKVYTATKVLSFIANYDKELRIGDNIRKREKVKKMTKFVKKIKKIYEEAVAVLKKIQEDMKRQADRGRKESEN